MKDPAFLFYVADFNDGTQDFTDEEVGAYLRLLLFQFSQGHLPLERIKRRLGANYDRLWPILSAKFKTDEEGLYFNARLDAEQFKRKAYSDSRRNNIKKRYEKDVNNTSSTYVVHMENENENRNINDNKDVNRNSNRAAKKFKVPTIPDIAKYCKERNNRVDPEQFFNFYESKGWMVGKTKMKDWRASVRTWEKNDYAAAPQKPSGSTRADGLIEKNGYLFNAEGEEVGQVERV